MDSAMYVRCSVYRCDGGSGKSGTASGSVPNAKTLTSDNVFARVRAVGKNGYIPIVQQQQNPLRDYFHLAVRNDTLLRMGIAIRLGDIQEPHLPNLQRRESDEFRRPSEHDERPSHTRLDDRVVRAIQREMEYKRITQH